MVAAAKASGLSVASDSEGEEVVRKEVSGVEVEPADSTELHLW
jgi:hypothetical protein